MAATSPFSVASMGPVGAAAAAVGSGFVVPKSDSLASKWTPTLKGVEKVQMVDWAVPSTTAGVAAASATSASKMVPQILWMLLKVVAVPAAVNNWS